MIDFETAETSEYLFVEQPTTPWHPLDDDVVDEWYRGDHDTRAESPKARRI